MTSATQVVMLTLEFSRRDKKGEKLKMNWTNTDYTFSLILDVTKNISAGRTGRRIGHAKNLGCTIRWEN